MTRSREAYRASVIAAHRPAFELHNDVSAAIESALLTPRRRHSTLTRLVLDMLMIQALKAHAAVGLLAQHGFMEDAATVTRRVLELSIQGVYIGAESDRHEGERRAGRYLAFLWRQHPRRLKGRLPGQLRRWWSGVARRFGRFVRAKAPRWGPRWSDMFAAVGAQDLYTSDYALLSSIAHGSGDNQVLQFSQNPVRVHSDQFTTVLLRYSTRYFMALAEQWNRHFRIIDRATFDALLERVK